MTFKPVRMLLALVTLFSLSSFAHVPADSKMKFVLIEAHNKIERSKIVDLGVDIEFVRTDKVGVFASPETLEKLKAAKFNILSVQPYEIGRGGHEGDATILGGFPGGENLYHDYNEMKTAMKNLETKHPDIARVNVIGKTYEGRDMIAIHINSDKNALDKAQSSKPGIIFMGQHHAREHLSQEIPIMLAEYLLNNKSDPTLSGLLQTRDIWIVPSVNPDGSEYDISGGQYKMWRKNRRDNGDGTRGVDLNRNYGYMWGTGGSSKDTDSDIYMGSQPFSEPETQVIKNFVESQPNTKILLTFHTYSELILYPWGHLFDPIKDTKDRTTYEKMAKTMAGWNGYTPEQSSDLYITSGDTVDWAYGARGIFAFTFELSPSSMGGGGFYPGEKAIQPTFNANIKPCLYLLDLADDPYRAKLTSLDTLTGPVGSIGKMKTENKFDIHPLNF